MRFRASISELEKMHFKKCVDGQFPLIDFTTISIGKARHHFNDSLANLLYLKIWNYNQLSPSEVVMYNDIRKEFGLESLKDFYIKYLYQQNHQFRYGVTERNMYVFLNPFQVFDDGSLKYLFPSQ
jgi:hypothetical protein